MTARVMERLAFRCDAVVLWRAVAAGFPLPVYGERAARPRGLAGEGQTCLRRARAHAPAEKEKLLAKARGLYADFRASLGRYRVLDPACGSRAEDKAVLDALEARIAKFGFAEATQDYLPIELMKRLSSGEHPIRVWRAHRGLTREALAAAAGVSPSYLTEIKTRRKPGSFEAIAKIAAALRISLDDIAAWTRRPD